MADKKISELTTITTVDNAADLFPIVDSSAAETKKITPTALKTALSLDLVNNTSDANKPISTATQSALDGKASTTSLNSHVTNTSNPHAVTKTQVGLGNVDNTSDIDKPISTATQTALNLKQDSLGFTAENVANKSISVTTDQASNTKYPSVKSVYDWATSVFQTALGFTAENVANKSISVSTDQTSNTKYPSVKSVYDWATDLFATITQLNAKQDTLTGASTTITTSNLTASRAVVSDNSGKIAISTTTSTEIGYVNGVTSAIQTQLDSKTSKLVTTNRQTASYTLVLSDADKLVEMNVASANNLTIPLNSSVAFSIGTQILLAQYGAGQTTIVATSGVTIRSNGGKLKLNVQYSGATLIKIATDEWYLFGDIA